METTMTRKNKIPAGYVDVTRSGYHVRKKPETFGESIGTVKKGQHVSYMGKTNNGWYLVRFENQEGWLYHGAGAAIDVEQRYLTVKKGSWNIRSGPSASTKSLGKVKGGDKIMDQGETKDGYRLVIFENQNAWISVKAIEKE